MAPRFYEAAAELGRRTGRTAEEVLADDLRRATESDYPTPDCIPVDVKGCTPEDFAAFRAHAQNCVGCQIMMAILGIPE